ncbi:hypothetical protein BSZ35_15925 [Salinibacter sp. 10B]|nr:hypothetical protein BSZ35_15925 [Salinibacter sp. 10B]
MYIRNRIPHLVNAGVLIVVLVGSLLLYPTLPEQMPHHFSVYGTADAYWGTTLGRWLLLPGLSILNAGTLYGTAWVVTNVPASWISVPGQEADELSTDTEQKRVRRTVERALYWMATFTLFLFVALQGGIYYVAVTPATSLPALVMGMQVLGLLGIGSVTVRLVWESS